MSLDRYGISTAIANMLKADTTTLYGSGKLLQIIDPNPVSMTKAYVDNTNSAGLYIWAEGNDTLSLTRSQNHDDAYTISMRFEIIGLDIKTCFQQIDDAFEKVKDLVNRQMYTGAMLASYYTDSNAQVINIEPAGGSLPPIEEGLNGTIVVEAENAFLVEINRWI